MPFTLAAVLSAGITMAATTRPDSVSVVDHPPTTARNSHYPSNREPLLATPFTKLPIGAVTPHGWLRKQLELQAAGFHGHLSQISRFLKKDENAWLAKDGQGKYGWEEVPYWLKGFGATAYLLDNKDQIAEAQLWIEAALASQSPDGMFGPRGKGAQSTVTSTAGPLDLWANMVMLNCLQTYHEFTGDPRVIDLMSRYFAFELTVPDKDFLPPYWQQQRGADNLASVYWLYNRTGNPDLLKLAERIHRHTANWTDAVPDWHNVNMSEAFGGPATFYQQSHDPRHLNAAERNWAEIRNRFGQVPGGMFGGDENCRQGFADPRQAVETCGMVEFMLSAERLVTITGNTVWADRCEDVAFNSLPAAVMPDFSGLRYLTAPNHISSDRASKAPGIQNGGNMYEMRADDHRCCQHNFGHGWPFFAEHQWMASSDNGLADVFHCASSVTAKVGSGDASTVTITSDTAYPFSDTISYTFDCGAQPVSFPLYLRIPGWCRGASLQLNGAPLAADTRPGAFARIERAWKTGDSLRLSLPMAIDVHTWQANHNSVSIARGPLTYSLKIGEKYQETKGADTWPGHEILPTTDWNYALVLNQKDPAASFRVVTRPFPANNTPFTHDANPIELKGVGRRVPNWTADYLNLVGLLQDSPVRTAEPPKEITMIPMGAARLRISAFPVAGDGPDAREWVVPPEALPTSITASHCFEGDTVRAVNDGQVPLSSNDRLAPRFTWWDHKGSAEWVQWTFDKPRAVTKARVYWFDDQPSAGLCRVPKSWTISCRKDGKWVPLATTAAPGVAKDGFNEVTFNPVTTDALRIDVQLQDGVSAGILEWQVE
jgi:DUF1680 family protein